MSGMKDKGEFDRLVDQEIAAAFDRAVTAEIDAIFANFNPRGLRAFCEPDDE